MNRKTLLRHITLSRRHFVAAAATGSLIIPTRTSAQESTGPAGAGGFSTRELFSRAVQQGLSLPEGGFLFAGSLAYIAFRDADQIPDLPGWLPLMDVFVDHFGENTEPGRTNMTAAINKAVAHVDAVGGGDVRFLAGEYLVDRAAPAADNFDLNTCIRVQTRNPVRLIGAGRDVTFIRKRRNGRIAHVIKFGQRQNRQIEQPGGGLCGLTVVGNFGVPDPDAVGGSNIDVSEGAVGLVLENFASRDAYGYGVGWQRKYFRNCAMRDFIIETSGSDGIDAKCDANARGNGNNLIENGTVKDAGRSLEAQAGVDIRVGWQVRDLTVECGPGVVGLRTQHDADPATDNDRMEYLSSVSNVHVLGHGPGSVGYQFGVHNQVASNCTAVGAERNFYIRSTGGKYVNLIGRDASGTNLFVYTKAPGDASGNTFTGCDMTRGAIDVRIHGPGQAFDNTFLGLFAERVDLGEAAFRSQIIGGRIGKLTDKGTGTLTLLPG